MEKLGEGMLSIAFLEGNRVVLMPKQNESFSKFTKIKENLDLIDGKIKTVKVPSKAKYNSSEGILSYDFVPGTNLKDRIDYLTVKEKECIGRDLAKFLVELHGIIINYDKKSAIELHIEKFKRGLVAVSRYLVDSEQKKLDSVARWYQQYLEGNDFCFTHSDLHLGNIVVDDNNKLAGVIDFGNAGYHLPEMEFVSMQYIYFDEVIFKSVRENYIKKFADKDLMLLTLVHRVRHYKHSEFWEEDYKFNRLGRIRGILENI